MFGRLGWAEILVIVVLLVILFGHKAIPGMMKNLADGINVFKRELKNNDKSDDKNNGKKVVAGAKKQAGSSVKKVRKAGKKSSVKK